MPRGNNKTRWVEEPDHALLFKVTWDVRPTPICHSFTSAYINGEYVKDFVNELESKGHNVEYNVCGLAV